MTPLNNKNFYQFTIPKHSDSRGDLLPVEFSEELPFTPKRVYFLQNTPENTMRGAHCHHQEQEIFICISGQCEAFIDADGTGKKKVMLDSSEKAIFVGTQVWHEFTNFSKGAILLCLSSVHYLPGEENYEYEYQNFIKLH